MSTAADRIAVFEDTLAWIESDQKLQESVEESKTKTFVFYEDYYPQFNVIKLKDTVIKISGDRSFQAAKRLHDENNNWKIAVVNFANAFRAGGGVADGASAQEESLCRISTLYPVISWDSLKDTFYQHHHDLGTHTASDSLIYTEGITICKTDEDIPKRLPVDEWVTVDVMTIAAPDLRFGALYLNEAALFGYHVKRAIHMLTCAAAKKADVLVLGAFGCGAFMNNPETVAKAYKLAIQEFPKVFEKIEFAIFCPPDESYNFDVFNRIMSN